MFKVIEPCFSALKKYFLLFLLVIIIKSSSESLPCDQRSYGQGSYVCVCNSTYCDRVESNDPIPKGRYTVYTSNKEGYRLLKTYGQFNSTPSTTNKGIFTINKNVTYQTMIGFGGAFTDAAGINIASLSSEAQENLLKSYYSPEGIEYTVGRIPMASCDFSTHPYSYDDHPGDFMLQNFSLAVEDLKYKIPYIIAAQKMNKRNLTLFGSPWSAPAWMKDNQNMTGKGSLIGKPGGKYYKTWAQYFVRFLQEYGEHGIALWGITAQNEPSDGKIPNFKFQAMGWTAAQQRDFIALDLGPALEKNGFQYIKLMILDDARFLLPYWAEQVFSSPEASKYISGIAVHWYEDFITPTIALSSTHQKFPDKFILATEACAGSILPFGKVILGSWERAESYAHDILHDVNNWVTGWTDWNIALDMEGGPNWVKNFVDSPIIVNAKEDEFYKQPMFYAMGHFSKFVLTGSKRIDIKGSEVDGLQISAFIQGDNSIVIVILNRSDDDGIISLHDPELGFINLSYSKHSIQTVIWWT
ncbi:lysosomal acid glucosylceramidase-like [Mytilus trossulus]|uniref:lysosomal acid glucosylceramidase-like n=1 Tax=Mytilus trossulus TaxID=6551 RepID=UPI003006EDE7